jgi:hypothetical protein
MKIEIDENCGQFNFFMEAETVKDAAFIALFGMNHAITFPVVNAFVKDDKITLDLGFSKLVKSDGFIERKK